MTAATTAGPAETRRRAEAAARLLLGNPTHSPDRTDTTESQQPHHEGVPAC